MGAEEKDTLLQEKIKRLVQNPPQHKFSQEKRRELIARLYEIDEEKKKIVDFIPFRKPAAIFAAALSIALIIFGYTRLFSPLFPMVFAAKGAVEIYDSGKASWAALDGRAKIRLGINDIVKTSKKGEVDVLVGGVYHLRMKGDSEMKLTRTRARVLAGDIEYNLSRGRVFAYYVPEKRKAFRIKTPEALLSVRGTDFMVEAKNALRRTWVGVLDGAVQVKSDTKESSVLVEAGNKTTVVRGKAPARPTRLLENELLELEELYRIGEKEQVAILISTGKTRVRELLSLTPLYISSDKKSALPKEITRIAALFNKAIEEGSREKHIDTIREFENLIKTYPNPKYDVQFLLFIGAYYDYLGEYDKAIGVFRRVIDEYPKSRLASLAQCAIGIIYEEELGRPEKARLAYTKVIANYPESPELDEATLGLNRLAATR